MLKTKIRNEEHFRNEGYQLLQPINQEYLPDNNQMEILKKLMRNNSENIFDIAKATPSYRKQYVVDLDSLDPADNFGHDLNFLTHFHEGFLASVPKSSRKCHYRLSILYSPANSTVIQLPHHDIHKRHRNNPDMSAILIGTESDTTLFVYPKSHLEDENEYHPKRLELDPWYPVMLHGCLIHCGDKYVGENIRFHYYKYSENIPFVDATYFPDLQTARKLQPVNLCQELRSANLREARETKIKHRLSRQENATQARLAFAVACNKKRKRNEEDI